MISDPEGNILIDRVGRFESIAEDFGEIASTLGLSEAKLGWQNVSKNSLGGEADLSKDDRDLLYKFYEIDFEKFGYEK